MELIKAFPNAHFSAVNLSRNPSLCMDWLLNQPKLKYKGSPFCLELLSSNPAITPYIVRCFLYGAYHQVWQINELEKQPNFDTEEGRYILDMLEAYYIVACPPKRGNVEVEHIHDLGFLYQPWRCIPTPSIAAYNARSKGHKSANSTYVKR